MKQNIEPHVACLSHRHCWTSCPPCRIIHHTKQIIEYALDVINSSSASLVYMWYPTFVFTVAANVLAPAGDDYKWGVIGVFVGYRIFLIHFRGSDIFCQDVQLAFAAFGVLTHHALDQHSKGWINSVAGTLLFNILITTFYDKSPEIPYLAMGEQSTFI